MSEEEAKQEVKQDEVQQDEVKEEVKDEQVKQTEEETKQDGEELQEKEEPATESKKRAAPSAETTLGYVTFKDIKALTSYCRELCSNSAPNVDLNEVTAWGNTQCMSPCHGRLNAVLPEVVLTAWEILGS